ncbi:MAG: sulfatase [Rikenellaceae bacterium]
MKPTKLLLTLPLVACSTTLVAKSKQPNIIVIMADDQGYQDLGCYGSPLIKTPAIDKMAAEGMRLTDFYQTSSVSSASRAGLLTGVLNSRNGVPKVFWPNEDGMPCDQITIAEMLKEQGYTTACIGKWHLGDTQGHMPCDQGFDHFYGIPFSNDMFIGAHQTFADKVLFGEGWDLEKAKEAQRKTTKGGIGNARKQDLHYKVPLVEGNEIIEYPVDQTTLTRKYFDRAIEFVTRNGDAETPFFTYITPAMPHIPLYASDQFKGKSARGLYGDCIEELDWNIGRLLDALDEAGLSENTLIIYTSDNGPWLQKKEEGGSSDPLRGGKFLYYDGGVRVPCVMKWTGTIPEGTVSDAVVRSIDFLPTFVGYAGGKVTHRVDGQDISKFISNPKKTKGLDEYVYVNNGRVIGVRKGDWIYLPFSGKGGKADEPELFNIKEDISEGNNLIASNPEKLAELKSLFEAHV